MDKTIVKNGKEWIKQWLLKGSLVRKLPNYERLSQLAVAPSCQPHHHVNHIIMSITSSSVSDRERVNSQLKRLSGAKTRVFSGKVAVRGRRWRGSFARSGKWSTKCARDCSESSISHRNRKKLGFRSSYSFLSSHSFHFIHFNSFVSSHSFQFLHVNSFISIIIFHSFSSIHSFQFVRFNSW